MHDIQIVQLLFPWHIQLYIITNPGSQKTKSRYNIQQQTATSLLQDSDLEHTHTGCIRGKKHKLGQWYKIRT